MKYLIGRAQKLLSRTATARNIALAVRNQANCILAYYLGESANQHLNGEEMVARHFAPHCSCFIDVGANAGLWTKMWLQYAPASCRGLLLEPLESMQAQLLAQFSNSQNVQVLNVAAGDCATKMTFFADQDFSETSSLVAHATNHKGGNTTVEVVTLDTLIPSLGLKEIDFLKVDAEGYDGRVLKGANALLTSKAIKALQFEYNSMWAGAGSTLTETLAWLEQLGYTSFLIRSDGLHAFDVNTYGEFFRYSNFLAVAAGSLTRAKNMAAGR